MPSKTDDLLNTLRNHGVLIPNLTKDQTNVAKNVISTALKIVHSEAVQATVMASNRKNFQPPKFDAND